jgi:hypothetical protein
MHGTSCQHNDENPKTAKEEEINSGWALTNAWRPICLLQPRYLIQWLVHHNEVKFKPCVKASTPPHAKILNWVANHPFKETNSSIPLTSPLLPQKKPTTFYTIVIASQFLVKLHATIGTHTQESQIHHNLHPTRMLNTQHPLRTIPCMNCFVLGLHGKTVVLSSVE